jgi:hypothetical protein
MPLYMTLQHLLNMLVQIANKVGNYKKKFQQLFYCCDCGSCDHYLSTNVVYRVITQQLVYVLKYLFIVARNQCFMQNDKTNINKA